MAPCPTFSTLARRETAARIKARVGARVAELRRAKGWTQERLAEKVEASVQWVSRIEGGRENVTIDTLVLFANTLGATVVDLVEPRDEDEARRRPRARGRPPGTSKEST